MLSHGFSSFSTACEVGATVMCFNSSCRTERSVSSRFFVYDSRILPRRQHGSCFWPGREVAMFPVARDYLETARYEAAAFRRCIYHSLEHSLICQLFDRISFFKISPIV